MATGDADNARTVLEQSGWLSPDAAVLASALIAHGRTARFTPGTWVHTEGDEETGLMIVVEGAVQLYCQAPGDREVLIGHAETGAAIGQAIRFGGGPRLVTAICVEPTVLLLVSDAGLDRIGRVHPEIWRALARLGYALLSTMVRVTAETVALPPLQRLASRLLLLSRRAPANQRVLRLSQSNLAELLGLTRKTVNLYLQKLAGEKLIEIGYGRIVLRDTAGLTRLANS